MDVIISAFNDPIFQSMVIGPIMGIVFGAIFSGLTEKPQSTTPVTVVQTKNIYVTHVKSSSTNTQSDEGLGMLFLLGFGFIVWKYAIYVNQIHYYMSFALLFAITFSMTSILMAFLKGQITSRDWIFHLISPSVLLCGCLYLFNLAHSSFDPEISKLASEYSLWSFYFKALSDYGRYFVLMHVLGVGILFVVVLFIFLSQLHIISLMNQRSYGIMQPLWLKLTGLTYSFSGKGWLIFSLVLLAISYILINPNYAATWLST
ncbi:hypothetical protein [Aeromonas hydrophila]